MNGPRYQVVDESQSGHCCFDFTVVDTQAPHEMYRNLFEAVCECFGREQAVMIAAALNAAEASGS